MYNLFFRKRFLLCVTSCFLVCTFLLLFLPKNQAISDNGSERTVELSAKEEVVLNGYISDMNKEYSTFVSKETVKSLLDFAGNYYYVVECYPTGYMIYCGDSENVVEYSGESLSPYLGYSGNLYYGGPMQYYAEDGSLLIHTITGETIPVADISLYSGQSQALHNEMAELSKNSQLEALSSEISPLSSTQTSGGYTFTCVDNSNFFANMTGSCGYVGYYCGYVSAAILIGYCYANVSTSYADPSYVLQGGSGSWAIETDLTNDLITRGSALGYGSSINASQLKNIMTNYTNARGISGIMHTYKNSPLFNGKTIKNYIDGNRPVVLMGSLYNPQTGGHSNHSATIYGYKKGGYGVNSWGFISHYGWIGYSKVTINCSNNSTFSSMYTLEY